MQGLGRTTQARRLAGLLARRGFDQDTVERAMERMGY
jgi:hypothetical protein